MNAGGYTSPDYSNLYGNDPVEQVKVLNIFEQFAYAFARREIFHLQNFMAFLLRNAVFSGCAGGYCDHAEEML